MSFIIDAEIIFDFVVLILVSLYAIRLIAVIGSEKQNSDFNPSFFVSPLRFGRAEAFMNTAKRSLLGQKVYRRT